jgi:amino acid permease
MLLNRADISLCGDTHSRERTATAASAVFNLVKTIIGGGILSLPFAFDKCGLALSVVFMVISAAASTFTLYVIVSCSRRGGAATYEEVVRKALGPRAAVVTVVLLVMLTFLTLVAYIIFIKDLVGSLGARYLFAHALSAIEQNGLTIACVALISPFLFVRSMDALRFTSIFSLIAVVVLAIAITVRAIESLSPGADAIPYEEASSVSIKMVPTNWKDAVYAFPIISVSYLCHFNVLPVYSELHKPTRRRLKKIVASTMFSTWVFYMIVGTMGYLFAYRMPGGVQGDILNNFSDSDKLVNLGRLGLLVTILLSLPIICQPCRSNLERLIKYVVDYSKPAIAAVIDKKSGRETEPLLPAISRRSTPSPSSPLSDSSDESSSSRSRFSRENITYVGLTIAIMMSATACALLSPGVVVVWNLMGSTVGILISYVLPCASYVRIRAQKPNSDKRKLAAWIILAISSAVCIVCSVQSILSIFA